VRSLPGLVSHIVDVKSPSQNASMSAKSLDVRATGARLPVGARYWPFPKRGLLALSLFPEVERDRVGDLHHSIETLQQALTLDLHVEPDLI